jgi:hypothetical protein
MNFGTMVRNALQRAELPQDTEHLELAFAYGNDNLTEMYSKVHADYRGVNDSIVLVASQQEYTLPKYFDDFFLNSLRGPSTNPRNIIYKDPIEFFRFTRNYSNSTGTPNIFTYGKMVGYDNQLVGASVIKVASSLANYVTGTVSVWNGSKRVIGAATVFTRNMIGLQLKITGDTRTYTISGFVSATELTLDENYRGVTSAGSAYIIGDIDIRVGISGYVSGIEVSEEVLLNGTTSQTSVNTYDAAGIIAVTKSTISGGIVTATDTTGAIKVVTFAPYEYEVERKTILLWRIPDAVETLTYRYFRLHPQMIKDTDRMLFPTKFHSLIQKLTEADLREWADKQIPSKLAKDITDGKTEFKADADKASLWVTIPQEEGLGYGLTDINNRSIDQDFVSV